MKKLLSEKYILGKIDHCVLRLILEFQHHLYISPLKNSNVLEFLVSFFPAKRVQLRDLKLRVITCFPPSFHEVFFWRAVKILVLAFQNQ